MSNLKKKLNKPKKLGFKRDGKRLRLSCHDHESKYNTIYQTRPKMSLKFKYTYTSHIIANVELMT